MHCLSIPLLFIQVLAAYPAGTLSCRQMMRLQLPRAAESRDGVLCGASNDVVFEEKVDALKWNALGLWDEEDGVQQHQDAASTKQQERAVRDAVQHDWCELRNDEVEKPLRHQGRSHDERTHWFKTSDLSCNQIWVCYSLLTMIGGALGREDEWDGTPAKRVEHYE